MLCQSSVTSSLTSLSQFFTLLLNPFKTMLCLLFGTIMDQEFLREPCLNIGATVAYVFQFFLKHYQAAQVTPLVDLYASSEAHLWVELKATSSAPMNVKSLPWTPPNLRPQTIIPLIKHTVRVWDGYLVSIFLEILG